MRLSIAFVLFAVVLAGCAADSASEVELPEGVAVSVYQTRSDFSARKLEVSITNDTAEVLTIEGVLLDGEQFAEPAAWPKDSTTINPGVTADLPVQLGDADCTAKTLTTTVAIDFRLGDADAATAVTEPTDSLDRLGALFADDCFIEKVTPTATITAATAPREVTLGSRRAALVDLAITPTGAGEPFTIDAVGNTTLLTMVDPESGAQGALVEIDREVDAATSASTLTLAIVPSRCDPHAIAEDKRGTIFPLEVTLASGEKGRVYVPATTEVKSAIYDFVTAACG